MKPRPLLAQVRQVYKTGFEHITPPGVIKYRAPPVAISVIYIHLLWDGYLPKNIDLVVFRVASWVSVPCAIRPPDANFPKKSAIIGGRNLVECKNTQNTFSRGFGVTITTSGQTNNVLNCLQRHDIRTLECLLAHFSTYDRYCLFFSERKGQHRLVNHPLLLLLNLKLTGSCRSLKDTI